MIRLRLAFFSPLNPLRGGISDHSEELLPELAKLADVDIVIDSGYQPSNPMIVDNFRCLEPQEFLEQADQYDFPIYQLGNNFSQHAYMLPCMLEFPGVVVLQDYCLQHLALPATLGCGNIGALRELLRIDYGERSEKMSRQLLFSAVDPNSFCFAGYWVRSSRGIIVHSQHLERLVGRDHPDTPLRNITMGVTIEKQLSTHQLRAKHGYRDDDFILLSLSTLVPKKRLVDLLEVLRELSDERPGLKLLVVGGGSVGAEARKIIKRHGLEDRVRLTGWVPAQEYLELTTLGDVAIDVRETGAGETANSLLRAFAAGKPGIVSNAGVFLELPDAICLKCDIDNGGKSELANAIDQLYQDRSRLQEMSQAAREYALSHLQLKHSANEYCEFLEQLKSQGYEDTRSKEFATARPSRPARFLVSLVYRIFRVFYLYRSYGLVDTFRRIYRELAGQT